MTLACCFHLYRRLWPSEWPWEVQSAPYRAGETEGQETFKFWAEARTSCVPSKLICLQGVFQFLLHPLVLELLQPCPEQGKDQYLVQARPTLLSCVLSRGMWKAFLGLFRFPVLWRVMLILVTEKRQLLKPCSLDTLVPTYVSTQLHTQVRSCWGHKRHCAIHSHLQFP